jgi:hypothetical protein
MFLTSIFTYFPSGKWTRETQKYILEVALKIPIVIFIEIKNRLMMFITILRAIKSRQGTPT